MRDAFTVMTLFDAVNRTSSFGPLQQAVAVLQDANAQPGGLLKPRFAWGPLWDQLYDSLHAQHGHNRPRFFVAMDADNTVVGVGGYKPAWCSAFGWELAYGAVRPEWQGRGVGLALLHARLTAIAAEGSPGDFVQVMSRRPRTFRRLGFRSVLDGEASLMLGTVGSVVAGRLARPERVSA